MAAITAALIKQVREETGAGMMDVKKALTEAEGDVARAKEIIRAKGIQAAGKREGRKAQEGTIASQVVESANGQTGYAVELNSETDFVAKTPKFVEFADSVLEDAVKAEAASVDEVAKPP
jgi:elongation factor Ts